MSSSSVPADAPVSGISHQPPSFIIISVSAVAGVLCLIVIAIILWIRASRMRRLQDDVEGGDPQKTPRKGFFYSSRSSREASESLPSRPQTPPPAYIPDSPYPMLPGCPIYTPSATPTTTGDQGYPFSPFAPRAQESGSQNISRDPPARRATS